MGNCADRGSDGAAAPAAGKDCSPTTSDVPSPTGAFRATLAKDVPSFAVLTSGSPGSRHAAAEPDAEPELHDHHEFVQALRIRAATEVEPDIWNIADFSKQDYQNPSCEAIHFGVVELRNYYDEWKKSGHDVFWHRKSHQVVLAVVVCRLPDNQLVFYRGMNTEVSLPAGSLCAERAGIARAASEMRSASEIVAVAVLDPSDKINPLWPCEVCQSWLAKLRDQNSAISVIAVQDSGCSEFVVRVNGVLQHRPRLIPRGPPAELVLEVRLAEGVAEQPWEARELVYVDGTWDDERFSESSHILHAVRGPWSKDVYVMVGLFSDETVRKHCPDSQVSAVDYAERAEKLLEDRHVSAVLTNAPWEISEDFIADFGIRRIIVENVTAERRSRIDQGLYKAAESRGILQTLPEGALGVSPARSPASSPQRP